MKILVIDDDKFFRTLYKMILNQENFEVDMASDGEEGVLKAIEGKPDLILLDMILPKKDGFEVLKDLGSNPNFKKVPIIVISSLNQLSDIDEAKKLGAADYLPKEKYANDKMLDVIKGLLLEVKS